MPAIAAFGARKHSRSRRKIKRGRVGNVRKSAKTRREWGEWPQNQAARVDGQSVRIFRKSREIPAIAGFGARKHSGCKREIKRGRVGNVRKSAKTRREWGEWPRKQAARIDGRSVGICRKLREIPAIAGCGVRKNSRRKGEIKRGRV